MDNARSGRNNYRDAAKLRSAPRMLTKKTSEGKKEIRGDDGGGGG